ncbi:MAG: hypothetical protein QOI55_3016, partial [Actinomycetota bacterium]|nr:hypothetical protein [Actinomycetota bacterium]
RLRSVVCATEVVVIRANQGAVDLRCGGRPLVPVTEERSQSVELDPAFADQTLLGKRYTDESSTIEVLCTKGGRGSLSVGDVALQRAGAKPLPASD